MRRPAALLTGLLAPGLAALATLLGAPAAPRAAAPPTLAIDAAGSELRFTITRPGETIDGHAHEFTGEVAVDPARPGEGSSVVLRVRSASLETGNRMRDRKMRNTHLEVERFPEIVFSSTSIRLSADGEAEAAPGPLRPGEPRKALVEGVLALHGVERTILFPVAIRYDTGSLTAEGDVTLRLTDHAIPIPRFLWIVLDDEVKLHFRFEAGPRPGPGAAETETNRAP
ncbi:MAG: hypothetical protein DMF50_07030 [Acidobacteria bacterium]|nr:MAG: hypothetical protein DMF50_07030 [Acidobacteriota bacterium]